MDIDVCVILNSENACSLLESDVTLLLFLFGLFFNCSHRICAMATLRPVAKTTRNQRENS